jgi:transcriptional regulator with XRE-family HTH domain
MAANFTSGSLCRSCQPANNIAVSQERLAERANLSTIFISRVELGKESPTMDSLVKIAKALKVRLRDLVSEI